MMKTKKSAPGRFVIAQAGMSIALFCSQSSAETAYFSFVSTSGIRTAPHEFVFAADDAATIAKLRDIVVNAGDIVPRNQRIIGTIVTTRADYNAEWPFHIVPSSVRLTEGLDAEACDATPFMIEENLHLVGQAFLPDAYWCPWSMRLVREVAPPRGPGDHAPTPAPEALRGRRAGTRMPAPPPSCPQGSPPCTSSSTKN